MEALNTQAANFRRKRQISQGYTVNTKPKSAPAGKDVDAKSPPFAHLTVRIPVHVRAQLQSEADSRSEDLATTVRRHLYQGLSRDQTEARFEVLERKLDALLSRDVSAPSTGAQDQLENLTQAALDMERRLNETLPGQAHIKMRIEQVAQAYGDIVDFINGKKKPEGR